MIFLHFSTDSKSFNKTHTLLKKLFYTEVPGGFDSFTNKALVHRKNPQMYRDQRNLS
jgi:hypothetical protein